MKKAITDPDVRMLASIAATLKGDYVKIDAEDPWAGSPFAWIRTQASRRRGKIGEQLIAGWCAAKGLDVVGSDDLESDRIINGRRVEIKFSTPWNTGFYKFQQLRYQNYDYAICLGISPFDADCWVLSKKILRSHVLGHTPQHAGRSGKDTFWLTVKVGKPPPWLRSCGGTLAAAYEIIRKWRA
ncbi:MAG: hypothetical protein G01um101438_1022 [Parcubacteria group bacterium Gr01-1014_38]|nr:MAG: hypothetical protein G01um101438_1022 [Parcubacteria group bacterium Gr01-1014_38]